MRVAWASSETILGLPFTSTPPEFLPLDETHPDRPEWHYSLSKQVGEVMADALVRWNPAMSLVSLRFSNVYTTEDYANLASIQARPAPRKANVWAYVDAEDAGPACQLATEAHVSGRERLIIAAADTIMDIPTAQLLETYLPDVPLTRDVDGYAALLSSDRAATVIGYEAQISWRQRL